MNTEEIFKQSGYTIPTDKHDECSKRFDYWDMIAFADLVIEKQKEQDSNLSQHLVSKPFYEGATAEIIGWVNGHEFELGEKVTLIEKDGDLWLSRNKDNVEWWVNEDEANVC